ncbi:unnamed protein product [Ectocarpus sp. CCAP 1310/34]|nr:unnamed protein product [Ectocarpus sp. CCAP 1310/34]
MAPKLILKYFDKAGAAEPIRWALEKGSLEWEDKRLTREEFGALKPSLPNGQVPVLSIDGFELAQSMAILRYVGKLGGLNPSDDLAAAKCDAIMDCVTDLHINIRPSFMEKDEAKKMEMRADLAANFIPKWLSNMEKQLSSTDGTFFFDKMTVADIMIACRLHPMRNGVLDGIPTTIADSYPSLCAMCDAVVSEPKVAAFLAKHAK